MDSGPAGHLCKIQTNNSIIRGMAPMSSTFFTKYTDC